MSLCVFLTPLGKTAGIVCRRRHNGFSVHSQHKWKLVRAEESEAEKTEEERNSPIHKGNLSEYCWWSFNLSVAAVKHNNFLFIETLQKCADRKNKQKWWTSAALTGMFWEEFSFCISSGSTFLFYPQHSLKSGGHVMNVDGVVFNFSPAAGAFPGSVHHISLFSGRWTVQIYKHVFSD